MYSKGVVNEAEVARDRSHYRYVCAVLLELAAIGGKEKAMELINQLKRDHSRRPAFVDELKKAERQLGKGMKRGN